MLPLKNFSFYLERNFKKPLTQDCLIQANWGVDEDRVLIPSNDQDPPKEL